MIDKITDVEYSVKHDTFNDANFGGDRIEVGESNFGKFVGSILISAYEHDADHGDDHALIHLSPKEAKRMGNLLIELSESMENK